MRVVDENSQEFNYLNDAITVTNIQKEVRNNKLILNINSQERYLNNVETYSIPVAQRNIDTCTLGANNTYFTRLHFKGKIKLFVNETYSTNINRYTLTRVTNVRSYYNNYQLGNGYQINNNGITFTFFDNMTGGSYSDGWLEGNYNCTLENDHLYVYGTGIMGRIVVPEGKNATVSMRVMSTTSGRNIRFYKSLSTDNTDFDHETFLYPLSDNGTMTEFKVRLESGVYFFRQSAATNYYGITVSYDEGARTNILVNSSDEQQQNGKIKIYQFDEDSWNMNLIATTDENNIYYKTLSNSNVTELDGKNIYYIAYYPRGEAHLMGMECRVSQDPRPWIAFRFNGEAGNSFYILDGNVQASQQTFSAQIQTLED